MPVLWKLQIQSFCIRFFLFFLCSMGILISLKTNDLSKFVSIGLPISILSYFFLLQLPSLLPILISVSGLIASFSTIQTLAHTNIISHLRACGLHLNRILAPMFSLGLFLCGCNFFILSYVIPQCRLYSDRMLTTTKEINPLVMLEKKAIPFLKGAFVEMHHTDDRQESRNVSIIFHNPHSKKLNCIVTKCIRCEPDHRLEIDNMLFITPLSKGTSKECPSLLYETIAHQITPYSFFTDTLSIASSTHPYDILTTKELMYSLISEEPDYILQYHDEFLSEVFSRLALSLLPLLLVLFGCIYALQAPKQRTYKHSLLFVISCLLCCAGALLTKSSRINPWLALSTSLLPFVSCFYLALRHKRTLERGALL